MVYLSHVLGAIEPTASYATISALSDRLALVLSAPAVSDCSLCFAFDSSDLKRPLLGRYSSLKSMY